MKTQKRPKSDRRDFRRDYLRARIGSYAHLIQAVAYNRLRLVPFPRAAHFVITFRCNGRCRYCDIWKREPTPEMTTEEVKKIVARLRCLDIIKIIGGEPTFRRDLPELVKYIRDTINPYIAQVGSNGLLPAKLEELAEEAAWPGLTIRLSLDGLRERHNEMRGREDSFDQAMESLDRLLKVRARKPFKIGINFNVTDQTLADYLPLKEMARKRKIDFIPGIPVKPFLDAKGVTSPEKKTILLAMKEAAGKDLIGQQIDNKKNYSFWERWFLAHTDDLIFKNLLRPKHSLKFRCMELRSLIYILTNGDVVTCGLDHKKVGNLLEESLDNIWFSQRARSFRKRVDECPGCLQSAIQILSRLYSASLR